MYRQRSPCFSGRGGHPFTSAIGCNHIWATSTGTLGIVAIIVSINAIYASDPEMPLQQRRIGFEPRRRAGKGDAALDQEHGAVGEGAERCEILVDNDAGDAAVTQLPDDRPDFFGDARR